MMWLEILGYAASILVAVSLTMSSIVKLRILNLVGALAFSVYGALVGAYPVLAVNSFIVIVNVIYLMRMWRLEETFELLEITHPDNHYLRRFLEHHDEDIARFFPCFEGERLALADSIVFILRDMLPVGLVISRVEGEEVIIELDYVTPSYRDLKCARYFYRAFEPGYHARGLKRYAAHAANAAHDGYLRSLRFVPDAERGEGFFRRAISGAAG